MPLSHCVMLEGHPLVARAPGPGQHPLCEAALGKATVPPCKVSCYQGLCYPCWSSRQLPSLCLIKLQLCFNYTKAIFGKA